MTRPDCCGQPMEYSMTWDCVTCTRCHREMSARELYEAATRRPLSSRASALHPLMQLDRDLQRLGAT